MIDNISIHAPTRGATLAVTIGIKVFKFQSTLPREERPSIFRVWYTLDFISIHAPTRGATETNQEVKELTWISIHAPTRGATQAAVHI